VSFAYFPLFTGDYLRDTRTLSMAGHGCYLMLLMHCWDSKGPLPLDEEEIAAICGARSQEERSTMQRVVAKFFTRMEDGHYNERLQKEIERSEAISRERSEAGRKGYQAKAKQLLSKSQASATNPIPRLSPALGQPTKQKIEVRATRLPADWQLSEEQKNWAVLVHKWDPQHTVRESLKFRDHFHSVPGSKGLKNDWNAAWRNWVRRSSEYA